MADNIAQQDRSIARQVSIFEKDGFGGLKSQLPPPTRRAMILIDPSYEDKQDYRHVLKCVKEGLERFQTGCYMVWYPLVQRKEMHDMLQQLERLPGIEWVHVRLGTVKKPESDGYGLHGSGMFVINPPYTLYKSMQKSCHLAKHLDEDGHARL